MMTILRRLLILVACGLAAACASVADRAKPFSRDDFQQLRFLEGRWMGTAPDGSTFYEQYDFPDAVSMRSRRFTDAAFSKASETSEVSYEDGIVTSRWGQFSWRADRLVRGEACFVPVEAPSTFCWRKVSDELVHVQQRWTDEQGKPRQYVVPLKRL